MKILFWVGYQNPYWTKQTYLDKGIGGSEYCVLKLADYLDLKGHDVTISGDVNTGNYWGVKYINRGDLTKKLGPRG